MAPETAVTAAAPIS